MSGKTGQLSCLVSSFSTKPKYCELQHFHKKPHNLLVEQALLSVQAKTVQPAAPVFNAISSEEIAFKFQVQK